VNRWDGLWTKQVLPRALMRLLYNPVETAVARRDEAAFVDWLKFKWFLVDSDGDDRLSNGNDVLKL